METTIEPHVLTLGVPKEIVSGERRVGLIPDVVSKLVASDITVLLESGAGLGAGYDDEAYVAAGASIAPNAAGLYERADIVAKVQPPTGEEIDLLHPDTVLLSFLDPGSEAAQRLGERGVKALSFNAMPRITRAQSMDAMSSMSTVGGYKAVLLAANALDRFFPLLMTAAGTVAPARVLVIGAGVAGLQALATARRLGAVTEACDTRPVVREQVESVGAKFIDMSVEAEGEGGYARALDEEVLRQERDAIRDAVARADVVISTALVPGQRAPLLVDEEMVGSMRRGAVIVDLAAEAGGNCALTVAGDTIVHRGVTVMGPLNLPSTLASHASQMYARNVASLLGLIVKDGRLNLDFDDEIVRAACVTGKVAAS